MASSDAAGGRDLAGGDPRVVHTAVAARSSLGTSAAPSGALGVGPIVEASDGLPAAAGAAMVAGPLGLAGAGAATLGALRRPGGGGEAASDEAGEADPTLTSSRTL